MDEKEVLRRVIQGFELVPAKEGFSQYPYVTKTGKATPDLAKRINVWIKQNFPQSKVRTAFEGTYRTINFYKAMSEQLVFERLIQVLMEEFTTLNVRSFRGREKRLNTFISALINQAPIPLKDGEKAIVDKIQIQKKGEEPLVFTDFSTQSEELKNALSDLNSGDKLYLYDIAGHKHSITSVTKTAELGGKGKGFQRGSEIETSEISNIQKQIDDSNKGGGIVVKVGKNSYPGIVRIEKVPGNKKADFQLVDAQGVPHVYIQHKSPQHQQMSGVGRGDIVNNPEVIDFAKEVAKEVEKGRLTKPVVKSIKDPNLKLFATYGTTKGNFEKDGAAVQIYSVGDISLKPVGDEFEIVSKNKTYTFPEVPAGEDTPTLVATYRGGRNQRVPGTKIIIPDTRLGIYPASYAKGTE